jgi:hypothetical protein
VGVAGAGEGGGGLEGWPGAVADRRRMCFGQGRVARRRGSDAGHGWRWPAVRPVPAAGEMGCLRGAVAVGRGSLPPLQRYGGGALSGYGGSSSPSLTLPVLTAMGTSWAVGNSTVPTGARKLAAPFVAICSVHAQAQAAAASMRLFLL